MTGKFTIRNSAQASSPQTQDSVSDATQYRYEVDLPALATLLLRRRRWIVGVVGLVSVLTAVVMLLTPNQYTSTAVILPSGGSSGFSALKAMAGLAGMDGGEDANSSTLFPVILRSKLVSDSLLGKSYLFSDYSGVITVSLPEYFDETDPDRQRRMLAKITSIDTDSRTGEITLRVETKYAALSQALVTEYLTQLENFNLYSRRSEARERVRYLSRELETRQVELRAAEDSLEAYQSRNRNWAATSSPPLLKELARLKRDAEAKATTYAYLLQEYEIAKLDAQKDVPVVRILDTASLPTLKSGPHRTLTVLAVSTIAFVLVVLAIFGLEIARQISRGSSQDTQRELRNLLESSFPRSRRVYARVHERFRRQPISVDK
ncbi:MAG: Wzz/FepE/Etk N-terminal domain-containing protein [Candidatus Zixiibacteriota bacterium]